MKLFLLPDYINLSDYLSSDTGKFNFTELSISTPGTYQIIAYFYGVYSIVTQNFTVAYPLSYIKLISSDIIPGLNFYFTVTGALYNLKDQYFNESKIVTLNTLEFGNLYALSSYGIASFTVSFNTTGKKTIKAYCMGETDSIEILVTKNIIKIIAFIPVTTI